jgi:hypothetical protein
MVGQLFDFLDPLGMEKLLALQPREICLSAAPGPVDDNRGFGPALFSTLVRLGR